MSGTDDRDLHCQLSLEYDQLAAELRALAVLQDRQARVAYLHIQALTEVAGSFPKSALIGKLLDRSRVEERESTEHASENREHAEIADALCIWHAARSRVGGAA